MDEVCDRRRKLLREDGRNEPSFPDGRLLRYAPDENVADGASEFASRGFFDPNDCPPWETWVWFDGYNVVSFVPRHLIPNAQAGIEINCVACIEWVPDEWAELPAELSR